MVALLAWGVIVLAFSAGGLADVTSLWWLVLLFGLAAPVALLAARGRASRNDAVGGARWAERELLAALREHGELTPTAAAMLTSLTAAEAAKALEELARGGIWRRGPGRARSPTPCVRATATLSLPHPRRLARNPPAKLRRKPRRLRGPSYPSRSP